MIVGTGTVVSVVSVKVPYSLGDMPGIDGMEGGLGRRVATGFFGFALDLGFGFAFFGGTPRPG